MPNTNYTTLGAFGALPFLTLKSEVQNGLLSVPTYELQTQR